MPKKDIVIVVDSETIKKDVKLLFSFTNLTSVDPQRVAYKVANIDYKLGIIQTVTVKWESTLAFSLASKTIGNVVHAGQIVKLDSLKKTVQIKVDKHGDDLEFQNLKDNKDLDEGQISAENDSNRKAGVAVGFLTGTQFNTAGYIGGLANKSSWVVTYKPDLTLYISSNGVTGQTFDSIAFSTAGIYTWPLGNDSEVSHNSRWVLYQDETSAYRIRPEDPED